MSVRFEWSADKAASNVDRHSVSFDEASTVFDDPLAQIFNDEAHSSDEKREIIVGHSVGNRLLLVCFTERGKGVIRIVSARLPTRKNVRIMKKTSSSKSRHTEAGDMLPEYDFDYSKARPNRFAGRINKDRLVVLLDPDVSKVFTTPESVNAVLRALITTMPAASKRKAGRK
jgi:uncharacterized protein